MSPKRQRLWFTLFGLGFLTMATLLILNAFSENLVFFFTPSDMKKKPPVATEMVRLGGLVETGSVQHEGMDMRFVVTDLTESLPVHFIGMPPALFREGQGVVAEGYLENGAFRAVKLLAKHDEKYMPPEVARAIKESGQWKQP